MNADERAAMEELIEVIREIRKKCPWDSVQTLESLKERFTSETEEVLEAVDQAERDQGEHLCEELGDLLMLVVLESLSAGEQGYFTLVEVFRGVAWKMRFRHPGIFPPRDPRLLSLSWEELKEKEREIRKECRKKL